MKPLQADLPRAVIFAPSGPILTEEEEGFFAKTRPAGIILMRKNCENAEQIIHLIASIKALTQNPKLLVLIDEEGGRVTRLTPHIYNRRPAQGALITPDEAKEHGSITGERLARLGINVCCAPVVDLLFEGADKVVGDRSFGVGPQHVSEMGAAMCDGLKYHGVMPILKHIPGHGRAVVDSHEKLPIVTASIVDLMTTDFAPFIALKDKAPMAMVAHVVYDALDEDWPASLSPIMVNVIRQNIGFEGVLISDGLEMGALSRLTMGERAQKMFAAGLDLILHCNGNMDEMRDIILHTPIINPRVQKMLEESF